MYVVAEKFETFSPSVMKFGKFWIYDLSFFHEFWQQLVQSKKNIALGETPWTALMKAYELHLFSPLPSLMNFARDFHQFSPATKKEVSEKRLTEVFEIFSHLGLKKVEQLKRFSRDDLQKRFGLNWALFFEGILNPETPWKWHPYQAPEILSWNFEFDDFCVDATLLLQEISRGLHLLAKEKPYFTVQSLKLNFLLSQANELFRKDENEIFLSFTYEPFLQKDLPWILKLLEKRIFEMHFDYPIWKLQLDLFPSSAKRSYQLSLFQNKADEISWNEICQKLTDQKFKAFHPAPTFSYLPENCWMKSHSKVPGRWPTHAIFRPLIQEEPQKISPPQSQLKFTERLAWFDKNGKSHQRDYFIAREKRAWIWVFRNEKSEWYRQGIVE